MSDSSPRLFRLFAAALRITDAAKRANYLDEACAGDTGLRRRLEAMLKNGRHSEGDSSKAAKSKLKLKSNSGAGDRSNSSPDGSDHAEFEVGYMLAGKYLIEEVLGEGEMGRVCRAKQVSPVRREVAVKFIKAEMNSKAGLSRFAIESQSLAMMDHPNIAQVFDAGATNTGRPYFVMELVPGLPITRHCDEQRLPLRKRLRLFIAVCEAIHHAHQKGIIHRDITPANVLVVKSDDQTVPKVIDFGLAKVTSDASNEGTFKNSLGLIFGTPEYRAPELADDITCSFDTRSDVYSLGVLLYELVTGVLPIDRRDFPDATIFELLRRIRKEEIPPASRRLKNQLTGANAASLRQTKPKKLVRMVRGELDAIIAKALSKSLDGRYESAIGLARDVECYLRDEVVLAVSPTPRYRLAKMVRRNLYAVTCIALILITLLAGLVITTNGLIRQNQLAESERLAKNEAKIARLKALASVDREKETSEKIRERLAQITKRNELLAAIFTDLDRGRIVSEKEPLKAILSKRLVEAAGKLDGDEFGDPSALAEMRHQIGASLRKCGHSREAIPLLEKALQTRRLESGPVHPDTLATMEQLGFACQEIGDFDRALSLFKEAFRKRKASLGENHPETLRTASDLADCQRKSGKISAATKMFDNLSQNRFSWLRAEGL